jgi:pseudaminic acid biosynthesis-associated methylase
MLTDQAIIPEALRLEQLWGGDFGDSYVDRNGDAWKKREAFWCELLTEIQVKRVLEVGCNLGANLHWIASHLRPENVFGVDVNLKALAALRQRLPGVNALYAPGRELPLRDRWFDLTFTMGVLIHQPEATLPLVMAELVRCSRRYVFCGEYHADKTVEVSYREQQGALFKRDYGRLYRDLFPELMLRKTGFLSRADGWDDVTYWLFEKT